VVEKVPPQDLRHSDVTLEENRRGGHSDHQRPDAEAGEPHRGTSCFGHHCCEHENHERNKFPEPFHVEAVCVLAELTAVAEVSTKALAGEAELPEHGWCGASTETAGIKANLQQPVVFQVELPNGGIQEGLPEPGYAIRVEG
jgi:hypothetical protein